MQYAEVIYETGTKTVCSVDNLEEFKQALWTQNRRAMNGQSGGPGGHRAERVKRVLLYDDHPDNYAEAGLVSDKELKDIVAKVGVGGQMSVNELVPALRDAASPTYPTDNGAHESMFKMPETEELDVKFLDDDGFMK